MNIAVYGGSFNPLHIGHLAILRTLCDSFDRVLLVVSPKNPLKEGIDASSAEDRLRAAAEALLRHPELQDGSHRGRVELCDIEFRLPSPNYSINTLDALAGGLQAAVNRSDASLALTEGITPTLTEGITPTLTEGITPTLTEGITLTMVMGGDQIADIRRWREYERILLEYGVAVFPRKGFDLEEIKRDLLEENPLYLIRIMEMPEVPVSSSDIRLALSQGRDMEGLLM